MAKVKKIPNPVNNQGTDPYDGIKESASQSTYGKGYGELNKQQRQEIEKMISLLKQQVKLEERSVNYVRANLSDKKSILQTVSKQLKEEIKINQAIADRIEDESQREKALDRIKTILQETVFLDNKVVELNDELTDAQKKNVSYQEKISSEIEKQKKAKEEYAEIAKREQEELDRIEKQGRKEGKSKEEIEAQKRGAINVFNSQRKEVEEKYGFSEEKLGLSIGGAFKKVMGGSSIASVLQQVLPASLNPVVKILTVVVNLISSLGKILNTGVESALNDQETYLGKINSRLQGSSKNYEDITRVLKSNFGDSPFISQRETLKNIADITDKGVAINIEERGVLMTLSDRMVTTFDALDANLTRMIRLQQADITGTQLGYEAELTQFLNGVFSDTSYLNTMYDQVTAALTDATSQLDYEQAGAFNFAVQKWLGSLYAVGLSEQAVSTIAQGVNYLATGNVEALNGNDSLRNLFAMASGSSYSNILTGGLNATTVNDLLKSVVEYLANIESDTNKVTKQARAGIFGGMSLSDIRAFRNLSASDISTISAEVANPQAQLQNQLQEAFTVGATGRTGYGKLYETLVDNVLYGFGNKFLSDFDNFKSWKVASIIQGLNIPVISGLAGLTKSVDLLANGGIGTIWGLIQDITGLTSLAPGSSYSSDGKITISRDYYDYMLRDWSGSEESLLEFLDKSNMVVDDGGAGSPFNIPSKFTVGNSWKGDYWTAGGEGTIYNNLVNGLTYGDRGGVTSVSKSGVTYGLAESVTISGSPASISDFASSYASSVGSTTVSGGYVTRDVTDLYNELFERQAAAIKVSLENIDPSVLTALASTMNVETLNNIYRKLLDTIRVTGSVSVSGYYGSSYDDNDDVVQDIDTGLDNVRNTSVVGYEPGGCFVAGTIITMADGSLQAIETIVVGDMVMSFNEVTLEFEPHVVLKSYTHHNTPVVVEVCFSDGTVLGMTPGHPILSTDGWKSLDIYNSLHEHNTVVTLLELGDHIIGNNGNIIEVISIKEKNIPVEYDTYNIEVDTCHTYIANGKVVHNSKKRLQQDW